MNNDVISNVISKYNISHEGTNCKEGRMNVTDYPLINSIINDIPDLFKKSKKSCISSYHGKHIMESYYKIYVSNGQFIAAMMYYEPEFQLSGPNVVFKMTFK